MMTVVRGMLSLLLAMVTVGFAAGDAIPDHSMQPTNNYVFTGAPAASTAHMQDFTIANDGALYFKLKSVTPAGTQAKPITVGFMTTTNPNTCSDRYISRITNPTVGQTYGPYYMEAGTYKNYYYHSGVATTSYELEIAYHRQLTPNDTEPNDSMQAPWDIGNITLNTPIAGHLGYLGCKQNTHDYIRFGTLSSGNYRVKIHYDPAFRDKPDCVVWFSLHDDTASSWILSHTGPADVTLGPIAFNASHKYTVSMQSSNTCYHYINDGGGLFVDVNQAGGYEIQIYDPSAPPPVTIRWGSVEKATGNVSKKPNAKYLVMNIENFGTSPQSGYVEITVVDENRGGQHVFSDHMYINVPAGTTARYDVYADTSDWPRTKMMATASLYSGDKKTFLGSNYAKFICGATGTIGNFLLLEGS